MKLTVSKLLAAGIISLLILPGFTAAANEKTAYVNMENLFQNYYKTGISDGNFKKQRELFNARAEELANEIEVLKKRWEDLQNRTLNIALNDDAREQARRDLAETENLLRDKNKFLQTFLEDKDKELGEKYLGLRAEIVEEISKFIAGYAKANGYEMILDVSGLTRNYIPVVIYFNENNDITQTILQELNRGHEKAAE